MHRAPTLTPCLQDSDKQPHHEDTGFEEEYPRSEWCFVLRPPFLLRVLVVPLRPRPMAGVDASDES